MRPDEIGKGPTIVGDDALDEGTGGVGRRRQGGEGRGASAGDGQAQSRRWLGWRRRVVAVVTAAIVAVVAIVAIVITAVIVAVDDLIGQAVAEVGSAGSTSSRGRLLGVLVGSTGT